MSFWRPRFLEARHAAAIAALAISCPAALAQQPPAVPVSVSNVQRQDVPFLLRGLGTVQASQTVQVRSRVDGTLLNIPVTEGQDVKRGDLLAVIDPRPYQALVDAAVAKKRQDEAQLTAAKLDLARYAALTEREVASKQKLEATQALVGQLTAALSADDAQIDAAKLNLTFCYITAPFDGRVGLRQTDPGNFVRAAEVTPILPLAQLRPIAVTFTLPQDTLPLVQKAMTSGRPPVAVLAADDRTDLDRGELLTVDNAIDATTGTIKVKATLPNDRYQLWPGQFVNARLLIDVTKGALTVPSIAVRHGQDQMFVYVVTPDQKVARKTVAVARDDGNVAVIAKGLEEGQIVVTAGHSRLQDGSSVKIEGGSGKQAANQPQQGG